MNTFGIRSRAWSAMLIAQLTIAATGTSGAAERSPAASRWVDGAGFANGIVAAPGTTLHFVDYGGKGPALVFLAGLGNSAHVFDEFAPAFADSHRVVALTRRGYGESGRPRDHYDTATLAEDVRVMLDSLGIDRATLVGHSVAGDELTEFAARHPERVAGLVYLDAAYDRSHTTRRLMSMAVLGQLPPAPPGPHGKDRASLDAARGYLEGLYGVRWPASEIAATRVFDARGRWTKDATPARINAKIIGGESAPHYADVRAPVLAIYSVDRPESRDFPWIRRMFVGRGVAQLRAMRFRNAQNHWEEGQRRRLVEAIPGARVVELRGASHYLFLSDGPRVTSEMRAFLSNLR